MWNARVDEEAAKKSSVDSDYYEDFPENQET